MATLQALLDRTAREHNHLCPRQVLGVRMGMLAARLLALELPQSDKRLLTLVETDGCFADGIGAATGCTVGHRTLRVLDYGKTAATFIDTKTSKAVRIAPHPCIRQRAREDRPDARSRWHAQLESYQMLSDDDMLVHREVELNFPVEHLVSRPGYRVNCDRCGEEIMNEREITRDGVTLCRACAGESYYRVENVQHVDPDALALVLFQPRWLVVQPG